MQPARLLLGLGVAVALALFVLASLQLGDPVGAARARLEREADGVGRVALAQWDVLLGAGEAPASPAARIVGVTRGASDPSQDQGVPPLFRTPTGPVAEADDVERALVAVARERRAAGDVAGASAALADALAGLPAGDTRGVPTRLEALRLAREVGDGGALARHLAAAESWPFELRFEGASARLTAALIAAPAVDEVTRERLARDVRDALGDGRLALGAPTDEVVCDEGGLRYVPDPALGALRALLDERLPAAHGDLRWSWADTLHEAPRTHAAAARWLAARGLSPRTGRWTLTHDHELGLPATGAVLAARLDRDTLELLAIPASRLEARFARGLDGGWALASAADATRTFGPALEVPGLAGPRWLVHPDPASPVEAERLRLLAIRAALFALGAAVLAAALIGARAARRAARLAELRRTFVASVSHDLRTPLAAITGLAENLVDGVIGGERARAEYHEAIRREAARLGRLVDGLLDFARLERGQGPRITRARVDTAAWLDALERAARAVCEPRGIALRVVRGALGPTLVFDGDAVHRATLNLVENAARHSGTDVIALDVHVAGGPEAGRLVIAVEDRGRGLAAGVREDLFAPYVARGEAAGTGLGLTIVRALAEAHGGDASLAPGADGRGVRAVLAVALGEEAAA